MHRTMWTQNHQSGRQTGGASPVADPGERPGGPGPPPLIFRPKGDPKGRTKKIFFEAAPPPAYLSVLITASPLLEGLYPPL